jgi:flagellar protein FlgJ
MEIKDRQNKILPQGESLSPAEKQLRNVSELYEKQFLREMVKQMRSTVSESSLQPSSFAEKYYREQLDEQYVESWGDRGGIGLGKLIYDQLIFRYGEMMGIKVPQGKPSGPLPMSQKDQWGTRFEPKDKSIVFDKKEGAGAAQGSSEVASPWSGRWLGSFQLENGLKVAKIQHEGFQSVLVGHFQASQHKQGDQLNEGDSIGILNPEATQLQWKLLKSDNEIISTTKDASMEGNR